MESIDNIHTLNGALRKRARAEEVYQKIKNMIYYHQLVPGQKLVYQDLAKKLNISITPVIQALNRLEHSNIVRYEPNKGYSVGEITEIETKEVYDAREALDVHIAPLVVKNLNLEKKDSIKSIRKAFQDHINANTPEYRRLCILKDAQFHLEIAKYAHNDFIYGLLSEIFERIFLRWRPQYLTDERVKEVIKEHRAILNALGKGDVDGYIDLIKKHIRGGLAYIIASLRSEQFVISEQLNTFTGPPKVR